MHPPYKFFAGEGLRGARSQFGRGRWVRRALQCKEQYVGLFLKWDHFKELTFSDLILKSTWKPVNQELRELEVADLGGPHCIKVE